MSHYKGMRPPIKGRKDANQDKIVEALREAGAKVKVLNGEPCDLIARFQFQTYFLDCKAPSGKPTKAQRDFEEDFELTYVRSIDEAMITVGALTEPYRFTVEMWDRQIHLVIGNAAQSMLQEISEKVNMMQGVGSVSGWSVQPLSKTLVPTYTLTVFPKAKIKPSALAERIDRYLDRKRIGLDFSNENQPIT